MKALTLDEVRAMAVSHFRTDEVNYPPLATLWMRNARHDFLLKHAVLHQQKAVGALAGLVEPLDHGGALDHNGLLVAIRKTIVNAMEIAAVAGIASDEVEAEIGRWAREPVTA
ncbi:MAG: hypothetical protein HY220_03130 [Candidatus Sungbacteria bacterium]|uniref:Uncharacterized protein n=1 Tax=Candidatus Sungiibacteriota bacterium TaxID=2750080 RepID=A0A9D6LRZ3_9BACT|nr:hypothetical protein [Candidatus Sungbacteria bacterium]